MKNELISMLKPYFKYSEKPIFKLTSGKMSNFYIDCKPVLLSHRGLYLAGSLMYDEIKDSGACFIGGLTMGADPISIATSLMSGIKGNYFDAISIRKVPKYHGTQKWIEGEFNCGDKVVIVDDVATTGGSTIRAIERATYEGLNVVKVVILIDRLEGGLEEIKQHCSNVSSILTLNDLKGDSN